VALFNVISRMSNNDSIKLGVYVKIIDKEYIDFMKKLGEDR
jgi:hypothetical protein